ncbi:MAG: bifunctional YncE family protein/alkaline phosphatase family protein [Gemmataceae bacterium]
MRFQTYFAQLALVAVPSLTLAALCYGRHDDRPVAPPPARVLPGIQADGFVQLPNQWRLRPTGTHVDVGDFPVNLALHPGGRFLAVLHAGYREHEVMILDLSGARTRIFNRVMIDQTFYGLCFSPDGSTLYASGGEYEVIHAFDFRDGLLSNHRKLRVAKASEKFVISGVATSPDGKTLYATGLLGNALAVVPAAGGDVKLVSFGAGVGETQMPGPVSRENETDPLPTSQDGAYPYSVLAEPNGKRLFVSLWAQGEVAVIDATSLQIVARWPTASHPTEMALRPDGEAIYVACSNSTQVSVIDPRNGKSLQTLNCSLHPKSPSGNTPSSLTLSPDGKMLFVASSDANNIAVFNVSEEEKAVPLGFIPVGWYPTAVRFAPAREIEPREGEVPAEPSTDSKAGRRQPRAPTNKLYVANGKGIWPRANRHGPQPGLTSTSDEQIQGLLRGAVSSIDLPTPESLGKLTQTAYRCCPLKADSSPVETAFENSPIPAKVGDASPIKYCFYIIKENRTYDQVFGDVKAGNGDPQLCLFPESVTPNHHAIANEFVLLDNLYADAEVSADGHEWSMAAYATDFVEKLWPLNYRQPRQNKLTYPSEGAHDRAARPAGGYIWDRAKDAGISYRSYGEWVRNGKNPEDPGTASVPAIEGHFDPQYRSFDLNYPDVKRAKRFVSEFKRLEAIDQMPRLQIVRLPNDHTLGARANKPTPSAMVADNDLALGMIMEAITHSKIWPQTAVFVIEDDAQNGPDHVDAHRTVALVASPYCRRGTVDSSMYSTSSMLRTMELILGLQPMSQFDAAARPMYTSFRAAPDLRPYVTRQPKVDRDATNPAAAWGAKISETFDLTKEDAADDLLLNEVIWRSVKGEHSRMPSPVRAAFVIPREVDDD